LSSIPERGISFKVGEANTLPSVLFADRHSGKPLFTTEEFPYDLDTTSLGLTVTNADETTVFSVMDEMLEYVDADGIIQVSRSFKQVPSCFFFDQTAPARLTLTIIVPDSILWSA
jgi:hypothetical protein